MNKLADFYAAEQYFDILYRPKQMEKSIAQIRQLSEGREDSVLIIKEVEMLERALAWAQGKLSDFDLTNHRMPEHLKKSA